MAELFPNIKFMLPSFLEQVLDETYIDQIRRVDPEAPWINRVLVKYRPYIAVFVAWLPLMIAW